MITELLYPVPNLERPWGSTSCQTCNGSTQCFGHYKSMFVDVTDSAALKKLQQPPSKMLKGYFSNYNDDTIECISEKVLLPVEECKIWLEHLKTIVENHKRGAKKVPATRKSKKIELISASNEAATHAEMDLHHTGDNDEGEDSDQCESTYCATCGDDEGESEQQELWIACDLCDAWYHLSCEGL